MYEIDLLIITVMTLALASLVAFLTLGMLSHASHASVSSLAAALVSVCSANMSSVIVHVVLSGKVKCIDDMLCTSDTLLVAYLRSIANASLVSVNGLLCIKTIDNNERLIVLCNFTEVTGPARLVVESVNVEPWTRLCVVHVGLVK